MPKVCVSHCSVGKKNEIPDSATNLGTYGDQDLVEYIDVGATYYFNKNMSTFVDYKINLLDDSDFTKAAKVSTDNIVAVGLNYQF